MENTTVSMYPPTGSEVQERKDEVIKALAEIETLQEQKRLANAEYQTKIKTLKTELSNNMDWLRSKGAISTNGDSNVDADLMSATY